MILYMVIDIIHIIFLIFLRLYLDIDQSSDLGVGKSYQEMNKPQAQQHTENITKKNNEIEARMRYHEKHVLKANSNIRKNNLSQVYGNIVLKGQMEHNRKMKDIQIKMRQYEHDTERSQGFKKAIEKIQGNN